MKNGNQKVEKLTAQDLNGALNFIIMKNLFLTLAFVLATSFSFASMNSSNGTPPNEDVTLEVPCFDFTLSCGVSGTACGNDTGALIDLILFADDLIC